MYNYPVTETYKTLLYLLLYMGIKLGLLGCRRNMKWERLGTMCRGEYSGAWKRNNKRIGKKLHTDDFHNVYSSNIFYNQGHQTLEGKVGGTCSMHRGDEKYLHIFSSISWRKNTVWGTCDITWLCGCIVLLKDYRLVFERRFARANESHAGGRLSCW